MQPSVDKNQAFMEKGTRNAIGLLLPSGVHRSPYVNGSLRLWIAAWSNKIGHDSERNYLNTIVKQEPDRDFKDHPRNGRSKRYNVETRENFVKT
jgi:hypothetical protein